MVEPLVETPAAPTATDTPGDTSAGARFEYQPPLDGLRALAVIAVLLFHHYQFDPAYRAVWPGGFLGVDAFFVLSGFLITSLLVLEHRRDGSIAFGTFWTRRAKRLLPALFLMLLFVAALAAWVYPASASRPLREDGFYALFYLENWHHVSAATTALNHTWSLAVEEQWYLVWPLALTALFVVCRARLRRMLFATVAFAVVSAALAAMLYNKVNTSRAYYGTDTRAQSLLLGAALAMLLTLRPGPRTRTGRLALEAGGIAGLAFFVFMVATAHLQDAFLFRGGFALVALSVGLVIAASVQRDGLILRRVLSWRPLVALGLISYGVYLFHWPVYMWLTPWDYRIPSLALLALRVGVTLVLAIASYFLVERPIRRANVAPGRLFGWLGAAALVVAVALVAGTMRTVPTSPDAAGTVLAFARVREQAPADSTRILVAGDATALLLGVRYGGTYHAAGVTGAAYGTLSCGIATGRVAVGHTVYPATRGCGHWSDDFHAMTAALEPQVAILLVGQSEAIDRVVSQHRLHVGDPAYASYFERQIDRARRALAPGGTRFVLATPPCAAPGDTAGAERARWLRKVFLAYGRAHRSQVVVADLATNLCPGGTPRSVDGQPVLAADGGLTRSGASATWQYLASVAQPGGQSNQSG